MEVSERGLELIEEFEGFRSEPYRCPAGVPTIGYGTTRYPDGRTVTLDDPPIDETQAEGYLRWDVSKAAKAVEQYVTKPLDQNQFDALVSFTYNLGAGNLERSTLLKKVNKDPDDPSIGHEFMRWSYVDNKPSRGVARRRRAEAQLYAS